MSRRPSVYIQHAPFSVVGMTYPENDSREIAKRLGRAYVCSQPGVFDDTATRDAKDCPTCGAKTYWEREYRKERRTDAQTGKEKACIAIYARCQTHGRSDTWGQAQPMQAPPEPTHAEPPQKPVEPKKETPMAGSLDAIVDERISTVVGQRLESLEAKSLDPETVRNMVAEAIAQCNATVRTVEVISEAFTARAEGVRHPIFDEMLERIALGQRAFLLVGPAGTGKTTMSERLRDVLKACGTTFTMSEDMRRESMVGHKGYDIQRGTTPYQETALCQDLDASVAEGHPFVITVFEEVDGANPNVMLTINTLENGFLVTSDDKDRPRRTRGPNHIIIATANTFASANTGSANYVGRNQLDAATLSRYVTLWVGYDPKVERAIVGNDAVVSLFEAMRDRADKLRLRRVLCTRMARQLAQDVRLSKYKDSALSEVASDMLKNKGWQADEIARVMA